MDKIALSDLFKRRRRWRLLSVVALLIVVGLLAQQIIIRQPKTAHGYGVSEDGAVVVITGGSPDGKDAYRIDKDGHLWHIDAAPDFSWPEQYAPYIANSPVNNSIGVQRRVTSDWGLRVEQGARVYIEGSQEFASLSVDNTETDHGEGSKILQAAADRNGKINHPLYQNDYWATRFTGYVRVDPGDDFDLVSNNPQDGVMIEVNVRDAASAATNQHFIHPANPCLTIPLPYCQLTTLDTNEWKIYFREKLDVASTNQWGGDVGVPTWDVFNNWWMPGNQPLYVPVRFTFGEAVMQSDFNIYFGRMFNDTLLDLDRLYSSESDGTVDTSRPGQMQFEYFIYKDDNIRSDLSNAVLTASKSNMVLSADLNFFGGPMIGGKFSYEYGNSNSGNGQDDKQTPLGDLAINAAGGNAVLSAYKYYAPRHTNMPLNESAFDWPAYINAGLTLSVSGRVSLLNTEAIDLDGAGYPGWANEFNNGATAYHKTAGSGPGGGQSCSGSTNNGGVGGGAWFVRTGGPLSCDHGGPYGTAPIKYGDGSEYMDKTINVTKDDYTKNLLIGLGSGGGASAGQNQSVNIGGSGGGALKLSASRVVLDVASAISADGDSGIKVVDTSGGTGGSGGKVVIITDDLAMRETGTITAKGGTITGAGYTSGFSAGSAGFITVVYAGLSFGNLDKDHYEDYFIVTGGSGSASQYNGENGILSIVKKPAGAYQKPGVTVKKLLKPVQRPFGKDDTTFNPYALKIDDVIRVELEIVRGYYQTQDVEINDDFLKIKPAGNIGCIYIDGQHDPTMTDVVNNNNDSLEFKIPSGRNSAWYNCRVVKL